MTLNFHYNEHHALAKLHHTMDKSEFFEAQKLKHQWVLPCFLLTILLLNFLLKEDHTWDIFHLAIPVTLVAMAILWITLIHPLYWKRRIKKEFKSIVHSLTWTKAYGEITIRLDEDRFHFSGPLETSSVVWSTILEPALTKDHLFIPREDGRLLAAPIAEIGQKNAKQAYELIKAYVAKANPKPEKTDEPENDSLY